MIEIGLMGCGTVADYGHLPAICQTRGLSLRALLDPDRRRLEVAGEKFGVPASGRFTDVNAFFAEGLDAVSVTSPAPFHLENVLAAARHGVHVLCEKPLAENEADGLKMVEAMKQAKRHLFVGFIYRFSEMTRRVRDAIRDGAIGELRSIRLVNIWDCHGKYIRDPNSPVVQADAAADDHGRVLNLRRDRFMREGGPMIDCGVHQIDLARWWAGSEIDSFTGHGTRIDDEYNTPDHVYIHATHENGVHSMIESSYSYGHTAREQQTHYRFEAIGTNGIIFFDSAINSFQLATPDAITRFPFNQGKGFNAMYEQFRDAIETGQAGAFATGEDGIIATRIARQAVAMVADHHLDRRSER
jgi:predicted dehydrogenase